jgi:hypothetical protein
MADTKAGSLPLPKFGGVAAGAKPLAPTVPLVKADKRFMPAKKSPRKKLAFSRGVTAFNKGPRAFSPGA